jgi:hypothetical protein
MLRDSEDLVSIVNYSKYESRSWGSRTLSARLRRSRERCAPLGTGGLLRGTAAGGEVAVKGWYWCKVDDHITIQ